MNVTAPLKQFMDAVDRQINRHHADRLDPFRHFVREIDKDRESRAAGNGTTDYFKRQTWDFLKGDM
jgi:hypothetical protein